MTPLSPPPWLYMQQRFGPPPSYPNLRIPGLNSPIPPGCQYGNHLEGWGRPPVDEQGRPLYGDVFGVYQEENAQPAIQAEDIVLWGEVPDNVVGENEEEENEEEENEEMMVRGGMRGQHVEEEEEEEEEEEPATTAVIPGSETPAAIQLRKEAGDETPYEPKSLYTRLEEVEVSGSSGLMPVTKKYIIPGKN